MEQTVKFKFRVRDKGGKLANTSLEMEAPEFVWEKFKNLPNAEEFCRKAYYSQVKKIIREICSDQKNGTTMQSLSTMEGVITRSLNFTKKDILEWIESRDWNQAQLNKPIPEALEILKTRLPEFSQPHPISLNKQTKNRLAEIISSVADTPNDPIADYLFSKLTLEEEKTNWLPEL